MKTILITGVSTGIGKATARSFLERGYKVLGTVRKPGDATGLSELGRDRFAELAADLTDDAQIASLGEKLGQILSGGILHGLVNNAGVATVGAMLHQPIEEIHSQFALNYFAPLKLVRLCFPFLRRSGRSRILMISSVAGKVAFPFLGAYAASKHALEAQSASLRRELLPYGIDVVVIEPGAVKTPIWTKLNPETQKFMESSDYAAAFVRVQRQMTASAEAGLSAEFLARKLVDIWESARPKTCYTLLRRKFSSWILPRLLPERLLDSLLGKALGLLPRR